MPNKTLLLTGASSGIGLATVQTFLKNNWNVIATMRHPTKAINFPTPKTLLLTELDVTKPETIKKAIESGIKQFSTIDVVLNNAGYAALGPFEAGSDLQYQKQFDVNVFGLMAVTKAILPYFREQNRGCFINVASVGGRMGIPYLSLYNSTKWAVEGFSESLQYELKQHNIKIKIIEPGVIKTDFYDRSLDTLKGELTMAYEPQAGAFIKNLPRTLSYASPPEAVAKVIFKAACDKSNRLRYPAAGNASFILALRKWLPNRLFVSIMRKSLGL